MDSNTKFYLSYRYEDEPHFRRKAVGCNRTQLIFEINDLILLAGIVDFSVGIHDLIDVKYQSFSL